jgi:predicted regulator of Ras-like GTPase activity (Roadblock/LC7/MglB family)
MFNEFFELFHKKMPEIRMIGIWGKDGLELEKKTYAPFDFELELLGAEIADVVSRMDRIRIRSKDFRIEIISRGTKLGIFSITPQYFLLVVAAEGLMFGQIKFFLDLYREKLQSLL